MVHPHLHLGVAPTGYLYDHVEGLLVIIGVKGNVMEWRHWNPSFIPC